MLQRKVRLLFAVFTMVSGQAVSQNLLQARYEVPHTMPLLTFLDSLERQQPTRFFYLEKWLKSISLERTSERSLNDILSSALGETEINFVPLGTHSVIFFRDPSGDIARENTISRARGRNKTVERVSFGSQDNFKPGKKLLLRGRVVDENNLESIPGVAIYLHELDLSFITDAQGSYEIIIPGGEYLITHSSMNYQEKIINLIVYEDAELTVILEDEPNQLDEVVISDQSIINRRIGQSVLDMSEFKRSPAFLGEPDLIKQIQLKSGVTTTSEASSGFHVRGGGVDQNLVLYDGTPIFNTAHALGFFTAFNAESIRGATFYKGGIPAEFGGRTSSVLNIVSKEGDFKKWHGKAGLGLVASDLVVGGPVKKDTSSILIGFRSSYSDWMLDLLKTRFNGISQGSIRFYDGSLKYSHKINPSNKISFSAYTSEDRFSLASDTLNQWQNVAASVILDRTINPNFFVTGTLSFGRFQYNVTDQDPATAFILGYGITYPAVKIDFNHNTLFHKKSFGFHSTYYSFSPGDLQPLSDESSVAGALMPNETAVESAIYISDIFDYTDMLQLEGGLRVSLFNRVGPGEVFQYAPGKPLETENTINSRVYGRGDFMKTYVGFEPRFSLNYILNLQSSLKVGFNRIHQYVHLISNTATITPVDIWQASNTYFEPQRADQISVGYFRNSKDSRYEMVIEAYYKYQKNVLEFKDGASLILNPQLETDLLTGKGKSYGIELALIKTGGRVQGGLTYTYSRSLRMVNGDAETEKINGGDWYPANSDQPHVLNMNGNFHITRRIHLTGTFLYHTGRPVSLASAAYMVDGVVISEFDKRNNYRIPNYHRLDLAFVIEGSNKKDKRLESYWTFSIYNVYGRKNPYSIFFANLGGGILKPYQLSLIGSAVPSVSYSIRF